MRPLNATRLRAGIRVIEKNTMINIKAFSLIEIIMVIAILGVLASIAIPKIVAPGEGVLASDGKQTLILVLGAQKRYQLENGAYAANIANLDVTIPASRYFAVPEANNPGGAGIVGKVQKVLDPIYRLQIYDTGRIQCEDTVNAAPDNQTAGSCAPIGCTKTVGALDKMCGS